MHGKINFTRLLVVLVMAVTLLNCHSGDNLLEKVIGAVKRDDLQEVRKYLTGKALEQIKTSQDLEPWRKVLSDSHNHSLSVDTKYDYINNMVVGTGYAVFAIETNKSVIGKFELTCEETLGFNKDHGMPVNCKISDFGAPKIMDASFVESQLLIYAYACGYLYFQENLFTVLKDNPILSVKNPVGTNGPIPLEEINSRVTKEYGSTFCVRTYQILEKQTI